jgi:hypothetical protein
VRFAIRATIAPLRADRDSGGPIRHGSQVDAADGVTFYPLDRGVRGFVLALTVFAIAGFGAWAIVDGIATAASGNAWGFAVIAFGVAILAFGLVGSRAGVELIRLRRRPQPLFRLDGRGVECARGRYRWQAVERVLEVVDSPGAERPGRRSALCFVLRDGATADPADDEYLDRRSAGALGAAWLAPPGMFVTAPARADEAIEAIMSLYDGPVASIRSTDLARFQGSA